MRILFCHNLFREIGGQNRFIQWEINELEKRGHEIILYAKDSRDIEQYSLLKKMLIPFECIYSQRSYKEVIKIIEKYNPDVAHVHNVFPLISPSIYYAIKKKKIPIVQTIHDYRILCPNGLFFTHGKICDTCKYGNTYYAIRNKCLHNSYWISAIYALSIGFHHLIADTFRKQIDKYIAISNITASKMIEGNISEERIEIKYSYAISKVYKQKEKVGQYFLFVGRHSAEKGIIVLLNAYLKLKGGNLKIVGQGPLTKELKNKVNNLNITGVEFLGYVSDNELSDIYREAFCTIIPSIWHETFGVVANESFKTATPVIASRIGALPEIVEHYVNGLLFEPNNSDDLAIQMKYLLQNPEKALEFGNNGLKMVEDKFNVKKSIDKLESIYKSLIIENSE